MPTAEKFNWHDYIDLRDPQPKNAGDRNELATIAANRAKLEGILDNIARTDDGQALIKQGFEVSGSGRNKIIMSTARPATDHQNGGESGAADFVPQFELQKDNTGNVVKDENGKPVRMKDENGKPIPLKDEKGEPIYTGYLTVNFNEPGKTGYVVEGRDDSFDTVMDGKHIKVSSQTNVVVHELFHLSDPSLRPHVSCRFIKRRCIKNWKISSSSKA